MLVQVDVVEADLRVEVGYRAEVILCMRDGPGEVVRDAGPRVEKDVAVNAGDVHCDNDSCGAQNVVHGQFGDGVVYREVVVQVCNGKGLFLVVEKDLVLFKEFHPPEFVYVRIEWLACPMRLPLSVTMKWSLALILRLTPGMILLLVTAFSKVLIILTPWRQVLP